VSEAWYYAREGKPSGPVGREEIENLLRAGTITPGTLVWREGTPDWVAAGTVFSSPGTDSAPASPAIPAAVSTPSAVPLDISACLREGWQTFQVHWGVLIVGWLVAVVVIPMLVSSPFVVADIAIGGLPVEGKPPEMTAARAVVNLASMLAGILVNTPLQAGFFLLCLQALRSQPNLGVVFEPFRKCWLALILATLAIFGVTLAVLAVPVGGAVWAIAQKSWAVAAVLGVLALAAGIYLSLCWLFIPALVADAGQKPLQAMASSFRIVHSNLVPVFGLGAVCLAINLVGFLCCCVGLIVTAPLTSVVLMAAYRRLAFSQG